jgi:2-polyprenyl-3-methyl-5-hydroxy-6-metoxy-1,4-benzoquinol methylase
MDLGVQYVSDFVEDPLDGEKSSLQVGIGKGSGLLQLFESFPPEKMYRRYWYRSGINESMVADLKNIVDSVRKMVHLVPGDTVLDIASNDGTLLSFWDKQYFRIGIDPAKNLKQHSEKHANVIVEDFFSSANFHAHSQQKAKVITSIAMFYDLEDPNWFVEEARHCLHPDGVWVIQMSYMPLMLEQNAFDNILSEHIEYYSFTVLNQMLQVHQLRVVNVELNDVNSGSFRVYITHAEGAKPNQPYHAQQIGEYRVKSLLEYEKKLRLLEAQPYLEFFDRIQKVKTQTLDLLNDIHRAKKTVIGYGASTKGNTLLQFYGITPRLIPYIAERTPEKIGKKTIGTGIPIISEEEARSRKPDYLFVFPWHYVESFKKREMELLKSGTQLIVPLPYPQVVHV